MSIWKTPDQKPDINKQICVKNKFNCIIYFGTSATAAPGKEWAYVADIITQANKAERLQKAVDNYEKVIVGAMFAPDVGDVTAGMLEESHKTIKQLIKGE